MNSKTRHVVLPDTRGQLEVVTIAVPEEGPEDHCRNALQAIACLEELSAATWMLTPELGRAERRIEAAVVLLTHGGPMGLAARYVRAGIEALIAANLDWVVFPEVKGAVARLLHAWYQLAPEGA